MSDSEKTMLGAETRALLRTMQRNELTESLVYEGIAAKMKPGHNRDVLMRCADEERSHGAVWQRYLGENVKPNKVKVIFLVRLAQVLGFTFVLKLMENGEASASRAYATKLPEIQEAQKISVEEKQHENALIALLDEERLQYVGSMVLGISDALVELTGTLAGLTLALQNTKLVALSGLITGISASLSMASSAYLSARADGAKNALKSCLYTGCVYLATVAFLVAPYLLFPRDMCFAALGVMLTTVIVIIAAFTGYISVAKDLSFKHRFFEMAAISLSVAGISFVIGYGVGKCLGIQV